MTCRSRAPILGPCPPGTQARAGLKAKLVSQEADKPADPIRCLPNERGTELSAEVRRPMELGHVLQSGTGGAAFEKPCVFKALRTNVLGLDSR